MNVTINGRFLSHRVTGVERYAREVIGRGLNCAIVAAPRTPARGVSGHLWEQSILAARVGHDLLWSPCNTGPLAIAKQVVTIHDCAFFDQPAGFSRRFAAWYQWLVPRLARRVRRVITISKFSCERLLEHCHISPDKVVVVPQGVDQRFRQRTADEIQCDRLRLALPPRYVLYVGNLAPRKNLSRLLEAWTLVSPEHPETSLVVAGAASHVFRDAQLGRLPSRVVPLGYVADEHLPAVYGAAELFVFPSLYEGFGLPVLEAMACGIPVITSNVTSLPEVAGDAALLVNPYSLESLAEGLRLLLANSTLRAQLTARGLERATAFSWDRTAAATWRVLSETSST